MIIKCNYCGKPVDVRTLSCGDEKCNAALAEDQRKRHANDEESAQLSHPETVTDELLVIGLAGDAGSGKDEVARYLERRHGFVRLAFADALKTVCKTYLGWDGRKDYRGRRLLQEVGMSARHYDSEHWLKIVQEQMALLMRSPECRRFVVSDCRFLDELQWVWEMRGIDGSQRVGHLWQIDRPASPGSALAGELGEHVSENEWHRWRYWSAVIANDASLDVLRTKIDVELAILK